MGFRYRKSINLGGGFRVNLSKSGIGYSWGVKGYRVTKTATGSTRTTVSIPGTGISYVHETNGKQKAASQQEPVQPYNAENIQVLDAGDISAMSSEMYKDLTRRATIAKYAMFASLVLMVILAIKGSLWGVVAALAMFYFMFFFPPKLKYTFDNEEQAKWDKQREAWKAVLKSDKLCQITATAKNSDSRRSANIDNAVDYVDMKRKGSLPFYVKSNIKPVVLQFKDRSVAIFPDCVMVFDNKKLAVLSMDDVRIKLDALGYLEDGKVPKDSEVIEYRWANANKDGSADKRFGANKQYPVMKYGRVTITGKGNLYVQFICSNERAADRLYGLINK